MKAWTIQLGATLFALMALSCGGRSESPASGDTPVLLSGRSFLLDHAEGYVPVPGATIRLGFSEDQITFITGCNTHKGAYRIEQDALIVSGVGSTMLGCDPPLTAQDVFIGDFLTSSPGLLLEDDWLTLTGDAAVLTFVDATVADADRPLEGQPWIIDMLVSGSMHTWPPAGATPSVAFFDDGTIAVDTGCNNGKGTYQASDAALDFGEIGYTEKGCATQDGTLAEEHIKQAFAPGAATYHIEASRLTIERDNGIGVLARAER